MNTVTRLLTAFWHSLPFYSWRRCCVEWEKGRMFGQQQIGITRDGKGRFKRITS